MEKLMQSITYDPTVQLKVIDENDQKWNYLYKLYAVIVHFGSSGNTGHYFTLALNAAGNWLKFNDSEVSRTDLHKIMEMDKQHSPYVYFYKLISKTRICTESEREEIVTIETTRPDYQTEVPQILKNFVLIDNLTYEQELRMSLLNKQKKKILYYIIIIK